MKPIRLLSGFVTVGVWTLLSRLLGFARDILIAATLGAGPVAEAFLVAFSLPNMFRRFFAEGAFNMAFVPLFSRKLERGDDAEGFARDAFAAMCVLLTGVSILGILAMPLLVKAMASGFVGDARFGLAVDYGRIAFPYILFISLAALLSGVLNAAGRFLAAAAAPVLLNVVFIVGIAAGALLGQPGDEMPGTGPEQMPGLNVGDALAFSVPFGGIVQLALVWWAARRAGFDIRMRWPRITPDLKRLARIAAPAALAGGVVQINLLVGRQVASYFEGAIAWLNYADRLYQLPLGVVGIAIGVVLLPDLSRRIAAEDDAGGRNAFNRAAEFALLLTVPAAVALFVISGPIVSVLYERGAFGAEAARSTALVTAIYGLGLPAFVLQKVLQPLYFARSDTRTPFYFALASMVVNAVIAIGLAPVIGFSAAAWATTVAGWAMFVLLWAGSRRMGGAAQTDTRLRRRLVRILLASAGMGLMLFGLAWLLDTPLRTPGLRYPALAGLIAVGIGGYFALAQVLGAASLREIRGTMRRSG